ncbi:hypothetical protein EJ08DRAFT_51174 [Tothia fuscella]|uniref:BTB domain-containing protein n=1 Tax=Tothia fuscella TaxID=1048955 RepID=A0A9P4NFA1_9PEZI|nr:hypothetical protein EJ08DRAFT_51174 [Tothia fuscella]
MSTPFTPTFPPDLGLEIAPDATHLPPSSFPNFPDGDVVISLSPLEKDNFTLYSRILSRHSKVFQRGLRNPWTTNKVTGRKTVNGVNIQMNRYELVEDDEDWSTPLRYLYEGYNEILRLQKLDPYIGLNVGLVGKAQPTPDKDRPRMDARLLLAYRFVFALMYEDECGPLDICARTVLDHDSGSPGQLFLLVDQILDSMMCYGSFSLNQSLRSNVHLTQGWGLGMVAAEPFCFLNLACRIRDPEIFRTAFKSAAFQYYFAWLDDDHRLTVLRGENDHHIYWPQYWEKLCGPGWIDQVELEANSIASRYDDAKSKLLTVRLQGLEAFLLFLLHEDDPSSDLFGVWSRWLQRQVAIDEPEYLHRTIDDSVRCDYPNARKANIF